MPTTRQTWTLLAPSALLVKGAVSTACKSGEASGSVQSTTASSSQSAHQASIKLGAAIGPSRVVALDLIAKDPNTYANQRVITEGRVTAVCQARGCWMEIVQDGSQGGQAHVKMHGHSFFVPRDASGRHARVEATVVGAPGSGDCEMERRAGKTANISLDATGVEFM